MFERKPNQYFLSEDELEILIAEKENELKELKLKLRSKRYRLTEREDDPPEFGTVRKFSSL